MTDRYRLLSLEQLFALDLPDLAYIVDDILPRGATGLLTAREKAEKGCWRSTSWRPSPARNHSSTGR